MTEGTAPKKGRAMTVIELRKWFEDRETEINKRVDDLQGQCAGCKHDCGCPERIAEVEESAGRRMDVIDTNVEAVQSNLEKSYDILSEVSADLRNRVEEQNIVIEDQRKALMGLAKSNDRNQRMMELFALIAGASGAICAVVIGLSMTGNL